MDQIDKFGVSCRKVPSKLIILVYDEKALGAFDGTILRNMYLQAHDHGLTDWNLE